MEVLVKDGLTCQSVEKCLPRENPITWPGSKKPWRRVHADFAGPINGVTYLVLVDTPSKLPEVITIASNSASDTISVLDKIFATHCLPETIVTDNATQFNSAQFKEHSRTMQLNIYGLLPIFPNQTSKLRNS